MNRYLSSFLISSLIYVSLFASAFAFFSEDSENFSDKDVSTPNVISVCMVTPEKPKPIKKKVSDKKVKKKKVVKKDKPKPEPKKSIPKQEIVKKQEIKEEVQEEEITTQESAKAPTQQVIANQKSAECPDEIKAKQNIFFTKIRNKINENKSYPRSARRRGIQGSVEVKFNLCRDGHVKNIEFLSGKKVFKKSVIDAIEKSFPMEVDEALFVFPKEFKISVDYILS